MGPTYEYDSRGYFIPEMEKKFTCPGCKQQFEKTWFSSGWCIHCWAPMKQQSLVKTGGGTNDSTARIRNGRKWRV